MHTVQKVMWHCFGTRQKVEVVELKNNPVSDVENWKKGLLKVRETVGCFE